MNSTGFNARGINARGINVVVLAGGVGGSRFLTGMRARLRSEPNSELTAIVNTGDDLWLAGLRITPDLDTIMYTLAGINDTERGWGRVGETERVSGELRDWGVGWPWFTLGDLDVSASIARSAWLRDGVPLHEVVERLQARWPQIGVRMLPATDDEVETHVIVDDPDRPGTRLELHFQEWWTRYRAALPALAFPQRGIDSAVAGPGVVEAIATADVVVLGPSNPVVSIGTILNIPGVREAVQATPAPVIGVSPIIGGAVVRGMADACLTAIGVDTDAAAVARHYASRAAGGLLDGWLVDSVDADSAAGLAVDRIETRAVPLWMTDEALSAAIAGEVLDLTETLRR
ncbi:MAG: 2-phospho-L-lactate transferase [Pseudolysinimonas sp.]